MDIKTLALLIRYDPENGAVFWRHREHSFFSAPHNSLARISNAWNAQNAGKRIESFDTFGYVSVHITIGGVRHRLSGHRVAWALTHGYWPEMIDHINGDPKDNRICNLRPCTASENNRNQKLSKRNTSGKIGVTFFKRTGKWRAWMPSDGKTISLGYHDRLEDAISARMAAERNAGFFEAEKYQNEVMR